MSLFDQEEKDTVDFFNFIYVNRKKLLIAFLMGGFLAGSVSLMLPKKYQSTGIIYPPNTYLRNQLIENPQFGHDQEVEYLMQLLESASLRDSVINQFNLIDYYKIDTSDIDWKHQIVEQYLDDVDFARSQYLSAIIRVETKDPELSADIVNYIIKAVNNQKKKVFEENIQAEINFFKTRYEESEKRPREILSRIYSIKDTSKSTNYITNYLLSLSKDIPLDNSFIDSREMELLVDEYQYYNREMKNKKADYLQAIDKSKKPFLENYVIDYAEPNYKKVSPKNSINAIVGAFISLLATLLFLAWKDRIATIQKKHA